MENSTIFHQVNSFVSLIDNFLFQHGYNSIDLGLPVLVQVASHIHAFLSSAVLCHLIPARGSIQLAGNLQGFRYIFCIVAEW